jgi:restriction system protein
VRDYWGERGEGGPFRRIIDAVRAVAAQYAWSHDEAKTTVQAVIELSASIPDLKSMPDDRLRLSIKGIRDQLDVPRERPEILLTGGLLEIYGAVDDGQLVRALAFPWLEILNLFKRDPEAIYQISPRVWEQIIAGSYDRAGFDEVILTPRSGDHGRDVIATKHGFCSVRIFDQVKAFTPGHVVSADEVRALIGVVSLPNVTKGIVTTTSTFAPRIMEDPTVNAYVPNRLELRDRAQLLPFLETLRVTSG